MWSLKLTMKEKIIKNIIDKVSILTKALSIDYLLFAEDSKEGDSLLNIIQELKTNEEFKNLTIEEILKEKDFSVEEQENFISLSLKNEADKEIFILIFIIKRKNSNKLFLLFQNSKKFAESSITILTCYADIFKMLEKAIPDGKDPYKEKLVSMRNMQAKLFPKFTDVPGMDISSLFLPVELMSGSFIDAFFISENVYQIIACNVSGFDATSSFLASTIRTLVRSFSSNKLAPSSLLSLIIEKMKKMIMEIHSLIYLTIYNIDTKSGRVSISSYGDISTLYYSKKNHKIINLNKTKIGIELTKRGAFKDLSFTLDIGDALFYYSMGVINATTEDGTKIFGEQNLIQELAENIESTSNELSLTLTEKIYDFTNYSQLDEDVMMIAIKRK